MTHLEQTAVRERLRRRLNHARQIVRSEKRYETRLRAQGAVRAYETAMRLIPKETTR